MRVFRAVLLAWVLGVFASELQAAQMRVPFNFQWGESAARVEKSLEGIKARIVERKTLQNRQILVVEGIPQKSVRRNVDVKYGTGRMIVRDKTRDPDSDILQTLLGYQWIQGYMSLRLFLFTGEKAENSYSVISLHYKEV